MAADPDARSFEGRSRLKAACVIRLDRIVADPNQPRSSSTRSRSTGSPPASSSAGSSSRSGSAGTTPWTATWSSSANGAGGPRGLAGLEAIACVVVAGQRRRRGDPGGPAHRELPPRRPQADRAGQGVSNPADPAGNLPAAARRAAPGQPADDHQGPGAAGPARFDPVVGRGRRDRASHGVRDLQDRRRRNPGRGRRPGGPRATPPRRHAGAGDPDPEAEQGGTPKPWVHQRRGPSPRDPRSLWPTTWATRS